MNMSTRFVFVAVFGSFLSLLLSICYRRYFCVSSHIAVMVLGDHVGTLLWLWSMRSMIQNYFYLLVYEKWVFLVMQIQ